jgi:hypothetical protein
MKNKTYDILKWIGSTVLPALLTLYGVIGATLNIPHTQDVLTIGAAVVACYNTIINNESRKYHKNKG